MHITKETVYNIQFTKADAMDFIEMMKCVHEGRVPDFTLLYNIEDMLQSM